MKKLLTRISTSIAVLLLAFSLLTSTAYAALSNAQIDAILDLLRSFGATQTELANVEASLRGGTPDIPADSSNYACGPWTRDLTVGSFGSDVTNLQRFLVGQGHLVMPDGVDFGYFGNRTQDALASFQVRNGITPAAGYFGPIEKAYLINNLCDQDVPEANGDARFEFVSSNTNVQQGDDGNDRGTFTVKFNVTAEGGDIYIPDSASYLDTGENIFYVVKKNEISTKSGVTGVLTHVSRTGVSDVGKSIKIQEGSTANLTLTMVKSNDSASDAGLYYAGVDTIPWGTERDDFDNSHYPKEYSTDSVYLRGSDGNTTPDPTPTVSASAKVTVGGNLASIAYKGKETVDIGGGYSVDYDVHRVTLSSPTGEPGFWDFYQRCDTEFFVRHPEGTHNQVDYQNTCVPGQTLKKQLFTNASGAMNVDVYTAPKTKGDTGKMKFNLNWLNTSAIDQGQKIQFEIEHSVQLGSSGAESRSQSANILDAVNRIIKAFTE